MPKLLVASSNQGKIREYSVLLDNLGYEIVTLDNLGIAKSVVTELGSSYEENATLKALTYARLSQLITLADDSGLEVDALQGEPGIHSARLAGQGASDEDRVNLLLARMRDIPWDRRSARFKCVIAIATPQGQVTLCHGECSGLIALEPRGSNGFGYDPIFYFPELGRTMAELPLKMKNQLSHRARAAQQAREVLRQLLQ